MTGALDIKKVLSVMLRSLALLSKFLLVFTLAKTVPPDQLGIFGLYSGAILLCASLVSLDVYAHTARLILSSQEKKTVLGRHFGFLLLSVFILAPIFSIVLYCISPSFKSQLVILFLFHLPFEAFATDMGRLITPLKKPFQAVVTLFIRSSLWVFPALLLLAYNDGAGVAPVFVFWFLGSFFSVFYGAFCIKKILGEWLLPVIDFQWLLSALKLSLVFFVGTIAFRSILGLDRFVIENQLGLETLGVYTLYATVALGVLALVETGVSAWHYPGMVQAISRGDTQSAKSKFKGFLMANTVASIVLMSLVFVGFYFSALWFMPNIYFGSIDAFFVISIGVLFYVISMPFHYVIYSFRKDFYFVIIYFLSLLFVVFWSLLFLSEMGILGAALMISGALSVIAIGRFLVSTHLLIGFMRGGGHDVPW